MPAEADTAVSLPPERKIAIVPNGIAMTDAGIVLNAIASAFPGAYVRGGEHGFDIFTRIPLGDLGDDEEEYDGG